MAEGLDPKKVRVSQATSSDVSFCYEDDDIEKAMRVMSQKQIRRLPILSRTAKLVGIVSQCWSRFPERLNQEPDHTTKAGILG